MLAPGSGGEVRNSKIDVEVRWAGLAGVALTPGSKVLRFVISLR